MQLSMSMIVAITYQFFTQTQCACTQLYSLDTDFYCLTDGLVTACSQPIGMNTASCSSNMACSHVAMFMTSLLTKALLMTLILWIGTMATKGTVLTCFYYCQRQNDFVSCHQVSIRIALVWLTGTLVPLPGTTQYTAYISVGRASGHYVSVGL